LKLLSTYMEESALRDAVLDGDKAVMEPRFLVFKPPEGLVADDTD